MNKIFTEEKIRINNLPKGELKAKEKELLCYKSDRYDMGIDLGYPTYLLDKIVYCKSELQVDNVMAGCRKAV